jgi:hypothetical protein
MMILFWTVRTDEGRRMMDLDKSFDAGDSAGDLRGLWT